MAFTSLSVALLLVISVAAEQRPCLPAGQEFWGTDSYNLLPSYYANSFAFNVPTFGIRRNDGTRIIKLFVLPGIVARQFDVTIANTCINTELHPTVDTPQCVPDAAKEEEHAWVFQNVNGDTLHYSKDNPSKILMKISANGLVTANYKGWNNTISRPEVLIIPPDCLNIPPKGKNSTA